MPHYVFELVADSGDVLNGDDGEEFQLIEEARGHALQVASELAKNHDPAALVDKFIRVVDRNGTVVFRTPLRTSRP